MRGIIGISGTPGTGKKTVAPFVASLMGLPPPVAVNSFARRGEVDVDPALLRKRLLEANPGRAVIFGHLLPHVLRKGEAEMVAVLRCEPSTLRKRLAARGYPPAKVTENVEAELIGVVLDECLRRFGKELVREYDTTSTPARRVADAIARDARGMTSQPRVLSAPRPWIDWTLRYDSSSKLRSLLSSAGTTEPPPAST